MKLRILVFVLAFSAPAFAGDPKQDVLDVVAHAQELDDGARVHGAPLTMHFKALGAKALAPMLEQIAKGSPRSLGASAQQALRHGLIEAVGMLRDKSATPTLVKALADDRDVFFAAQALARIDDHDAWKALKQALASASGDREKSLLRAIGSSHRIEAAKLLADRLDKKPDAETAVVLIKALGTSGNAAAWKASNVRTDEAAVRETAARAVMRAWLAYDGAVRTAATTALLVIDYAGMPGLLESARKSGATVDALEQRLAKNPTR